jgi:regulator of replication initiation timing
MLLQENDNLKIENEKWKAKLKEIEHMTFNEDILDIINEY